MKSIADFVAGKIRRSESSAEMIFRPGGSADDQLGAAEGELFGPAGSVRLYDGGMILADGTAVRWDSIVRARLLGERIEIELSDGTGKVIAGSPIGSEILYATIRWVGNALLKRKLGE